MKAQIRELRKGYWQGVKIEDGRIIDVISLEQSKEKCEEVLLALNYDIEYEN